MKLNIRTVLSSQYKELNNLIHNI